MSYTSTYVILAAGRGSRMGKFGETLHKALVPIGQKAALTRVIELAPEGAKIVVVAGYRAEQLRAYLELAHPNLEYEFVIDERDWSRPGGPGSTLLNVRDHVEGDLIITTCDTLWRHDPSLWWGNTSWVGVAPLPPGTEPERWCRVAEVEPELGGGLLFADKTLIEDDDLWAPWWAYVGLARIVSRDLDKFWHGLEHGDRVGDELQVTPGFESTHPIEGKRVSWIDVGDEHAYRTAVTLLDGYDYSKPGEATYVLPNSGRVVKFSGDGGSINRKIARARILHNAVPQVIEQRDSMFAYKYTVGVTGYERAERDLTPGTTIKRLIAWAERNLWEPVPVYNRLAILACDRFYRDKTYLRIRDLEPDLQEQAIDVLSDIDFDALARGCEPVTFHGDFNLSNVIAVDGGFVTIDWRADFAGHTWGDKRYDLGKLLAGTILHWDRAKYGDFRPWAEGFEHARAIDASRDVQIIAGLSLLNSAPLHHPPLDEILVTRGAAHLREVMG